MELNDLFFKENPFRTGPSLNPAELLWAGFPKLKSDVESRLVFAMKTSPSRIVLNWGRYGSGKTHAANYYTKTNRVNQIATEKNTIEPRCIKINLPRTSKDPVQSFFRSFLGQIGLKQIKEDLDRLNTEYPGQIGQIIDINSNDIIVSDLFKLLIEEDGSDEDFFPTVEAYIFGDNAKSTLQKLGLPFGLRDDEQVVNFLSTYLNCITYEKHIYSAFILWIDEFEDIDTLNKQSQDRITTFIRQLFDKTPNNFLLFLNFTPKTFFNVEDLSIMLGEALSTRAKIRINFQEPNIGEAIQYIKELIASQLIEGSNELGPFLDEGVFEYVLENIGILSVRKINEVLSLILELAVLMEHSKPIDVDFVKSIRDEIPSFES
ncbi:MAG TPA: hypothetical protein DEQ87_04230 [Algoriphagus sp.]|jgi:hypothetical protein|uniref:hypothetical protein n=5 Tax=Algoriphagus TaxID=246875 RepID=UPI000C571CBD|nr:MULTISPECIES: hypothetical protein [unclassified Algoriphagus]MAL14364.1 hypothetical protein [Algoriphagus sp.]MAN87913.1 hypothetical protein [Algoriphagus sp.]HCD86835.1 hypothetical protein [Algoriphagus sp.]|tara:strand:- start:4882 stop:6009 length:1128 start_codon:yes stop_codon:yes gene_type:complete